MSAVTGHHVSRSRAGSNTPVSEKGRMAHMQGYAMAPSPNTVVRYFEPCAATASMFLYAQGASVVCCHHDTLAIERRFARHSEEVQLLAVDNHSDMGAGRLVVSYDAGQTAIVWDLLTGDEVARFASYENITCAAWMRNGNVAFGNTQGNVILFEPTTSEHISARTIDQIAITSLSPAADCRTFAIGYQNGSLLIATLQPRFTILHNLTTSRGPSPIVTLSWHASSSRQKSDMLAVQTNDGDLRVWSVSKAYNSDDPAKVVRILKRTENYLTGPNWMGWSKNGRIIQYSESETISWDVRTKHVTSDTIPTLETIRGLAVYGPGATLFTLGANNTVQQFDLNAPAMMVANVQHPSNLLPPSPPISLEAEDKSQGGNASESESSVQIAFHPTELSEGDEDSRSPLARYIQRGHELDNDLYRPGSPGSSVTQSSVSISSSTSQKVPRAYQSSVVSRSMTENTYISTGSSLRSGAHHRERRERESLSTSSSISSHQRSGHKPSRLRHEVPRSPEESRVVDLFKFTKSRLADVPYKAPYSTDTSHLTNDDLRHQMLSTIFGWHKEVDELIRDEMSRHPLGSTNRILLAKWLGDINTDIMAMGSQNMTSSDWMLLALSGIGGQESQHKLGRAYVQRLLEHGDLHAAATIMIGLGDHNDAVEIYISHKKYMEALILTCLFFPAAWERQEQIVKKWGEWAVQHGQQQLAIRCFACTGVQSTEPWTSPSAQQLNFRSITQTVPELLSPPLSPPMTNHGPQRSVAKNSALKLITSFGDSQAKAKFFSGHGDDGKTPIAAAATPILESALSPIDPTTAVLRGNRSQFNTPASARPGHGFGRQRLPSIGEAPDSTHRDLLTAVSKAAVDPYATLHKMEGHEGAVKNLELARPSTASPRLGKDSSTKAQPPPPSPSPAIVAALMESGRKRNGSRTRIPEGLDLSLPAFKDSLTEDVTSPEQSGNSSVRYHWPSRRRGPGSVASSVTSAASSVARGHRGHQHQQGRGLDDYIHSLDAAQSSGHRASSRDGRSNGRDHSQTRKEDREKSRDRGRAAARTYTPKGGKRSPKSPVPMSPEDLINLATPKEEEEQTHYVDAKGRLIDISNDDELEPPSQPSTVRKVGYANRDGSRVRGSSRAASQNGRTSSRTRSPDRHAPRALDLRGRSTSRGPPANRSPSSPQPMTVDMHQKHFYGSEDEEDYRQAMEAREKFRQRNNRSTSRNRRGEDLNSPASNRSTAWSRETTREKSDGIKRTTSHAGSEGSARRKIGAPLTTPAPMQLVTDSAGDLKVMKDERQLKKEAAARELEERRKSLARRPSAPPIIHPDQIVASPAVRTPPTIMELPSTTYVPPKKEDLPSRSASADPTAGRSMYANRNGPLIGLPATPRAMRLVLESDASKHDVPVPPIPATFAQASPGKSTQSNQNSPGKLSPGRHSPTKVQKEPEERKDSGAAMLLPSTVYTPPPPANSRVAAQIGRSMSAPPQDLAPPQGHTRGHSISSQGRRPSHDANAFPSRRPSHDANIPPPPPPPPAPPMLKELQHLAQPPPPPPAPLPHLAALSPAPVVYGGSSGTIEIVMDDDQTQQAQQQQQQGSAPPSVPAAIPISETTVPIISPPAPRNGHSRGRSSVDNSIGARISRATERMRSASRSRTAREREIGARTKSPDMIVHAPYESVPLGPPVSMNYRVQNQVFQQVQAQVAQQQAQNEFRTGLHQSEMI
ncbi:IDC1 protein involved in sexual reproduction encoded by the IDC1 protein [Madurella fahalii]|uniref:IDC1 protein involved in sexual reproduction encoded by the IDC1 protein n=1 Tax=Madurella fahalii TaxID=1157608 RepID=A0ABQ0G653_9PEZI